MFKIIIQFILMLAFISMSIVGIFGMIGTLSIPFNTSIGLVVLGTLLSLLLLAISGTGTGLKKRR